LQENVRYDKQELIASSSGRSKNPNSHNAYGALLNGLAVCDGFSSAFNLLAQKLGFECMLATGRSNHRSAGSVEHAWNIVKVKNKCYHMDVTWDTNQYNEFKEHSYDYFALDDETSITESCYNMMILWQKDTVTERAMEMLWIQS